MTDGLKDAHREAIIATIAADDRVERAVLFGSRATATNTVSSDVDIALFGDQLTLTDQAQLAAALDEIPMAQSVDLLLYDSIGDRTLLEHIRNQGVQWYARTNPASQAPLRNLCEAIVDCPHSTPTWTPDGVVVLRSKNIRNGRLDLSEPSYTSETDYAERTKRATPRGGDLVITREAPMGEVCMIPAGLRCCLGQRMVLLRPRRAATDPRYLLYALQSQSVQQEIRLHDGTGSTVSNLRIPLLENLQIPSYPLSNQRTIAHVLGTLDDKIELNRRMNATLESMARALFRSWFVDFDPVRAKMEGRDTGLPKDIADLFPDRLVDSELGEIPAGWTVGHVEDGLEIVMGQSPPGHTYNDIGDGLPFFQGRSDFGFRYPKNRKFCTAPKRIAQPWDTIVSVRAPVGDINIAWERCCIGRGVAALRPRSGAVSYGYCAAQALQPQMHEYEHTGTVFGAINRKQLARLPLAQPAADVVRRFEDLVHPSDQMIRLRTAEVATLTALRDALLPKLVSGEMRVPAAEKLVGAPHYRARPRRSRPTAEETHEGRKNDVDDGKVAPHVQLVGNIEAGILGAPPTPMSASEIVWSRRVAMRHAVYRDYSEA